ncbi:hypothetical protein M569_14786, partial [Genlisea aurea]
IDPRSGFCKGNSTFYSKRKPLALPSTDSIDVTTFISSSPHRGEVAFIEASTGRRLTFAQLWKAVDAVAGCLSAEYGLRKGDVVLILSPNSIYFPVVCLAVMSLGAVVTTTNPINTAGEISRQISDSKPVIAFATPDLVPKIAESNLPVVLLCPNSASGAIASIEDLMGREPMKIRVKEAINVQDTATMLYSSGTTGVSKGVVSSHRNLISMVQTISSRYNSDQIFICTIPMFHVYGLACFAAALLATGATVVILEKYDLEPMVRAVEKFSATHLPIVPPILINLINNADVIRRKYDLSSLTTVLCGGAPLSKEVVEGFMAKYPNASILQGYGLTESTAIGTSVETTEESKKYGSAGLLASSIDARIVNPDTGDALPVNQTGELWLRGANIMKGYFGNEEASASALNPEGWLKTGDLCYFDDDGFLFVVGRLKELIKYKAYQVAPTELEALLMTHPEIAEAAVLPFPDEEAGEVPMACVVLKPGSELSAEAVMGFISDQVAPYKRIRLVEFVEFIPKTPSGKILRKDLIKIIVSR